MQAVHSGRALRAAARPSRAPATTPRRPRAPRCAAAAAAAAADSAGAGATTSTAAAAAAAATAAAAAPRDYFATDRRPVILFDGVCNLCNTGVNIVLDWDTHAAYRLAALQSPAGRALLTRCGRAPDDISSIVLVEPDHTFYTKSEAVRRIGARLGLPFPLLAALAAPVPLPLRDFLYDQVAANRYNLFGRRDACRLGNADKLAERFIVE